jgi:glycosyl transferase family 25
MEDDVVFHEDFLEGLSIALDLSDDWDLIRFNCVRAKIPIYQRKAGRYNLNAYIGPFTGNGCYLIKKETAARLLPRLWPQRRALDHELNRFFEHDFRQFGLEPFPSHVDDKNISSITGINYAAVEKFTLWNRRFYYRTKIFNYFRRFFWLLRRGFLRHSV